MASQSSAKLNLQYFPPHMLTSMNRMDSKFCDEAHLYGSNDKRADNSINNK